jgi:REP element-mobilizing transposase RayT
VHAKDAKSHAETGKARCSGYAASRHYSGNRESRIVYGDQDRREFVSRLGKLASETGASIYAWALVTNHAHILLSSGPAGLAKFMRRFLTGYADSYNLRHRRQGHLFQNRYRSIVCDGDRYFAELVSHIHLNPLRVKLVADLKELEKYAYCGHGVILGTIRNEWQDRDSVLSRFGSQEGDAKAAYPGVCCRPEFKKLHSTRS